MKAFTKNDVRLDRLVELLEDAGLGKLYVTCDENGNPVVATQDTQLLASVREGKVPFDNLAKSDLRCIANALNISVVGLLVKVGVLTKRDFSVKRHDRPLNKTIATELDDFLYLAQEQIESLGN